jgi:hypothetical protein
MTTDGGGWTLVVVVADDGSDTWTWNNRALWTNDRRTFGNVRRRDRDYKNPGLHDIDFSALMFRHHPSDKWASYHGVGTGQFSVAEGLGALGPVCYETSPRDGYAMTTGNIRTRKGLCSTRLYFNARDQDGGNRCKVDEASWGPTWNAVWNQSCPFDDPGTSGGMGPVPGRFGHGDANEESATMGFGYGLDLNTYNDWKGTGNGRTYFHMFVR